MSDWYDDISEANEHVSPLSISPSSDMFTSQQLRAASPPALSVTDDKKTGLAEDSRREKVKTVEEVNIDPPAIVDPVALESFLPLLEALDCPGLKLIHGAYHLRGAVPEGASQKLSEYARRVTKFTLGNTAPEARIDAATWFRVLELHSRFSPKSSTAFFPSLTEVCINGADSSLEQIFLLLSPSLESVDVYNVPQTRSDTLLAFLETVAEVAPGLSHIGVDTSLSFPDLEKTYIKFSKLRSLRISVNGDTHLSYDTLLQIGQLPSLEALILDASAVYYYAREVKYSEPDSQAQLSPKAASVFLGGRGSLFPPSCDPARAPSPTTGESWGAQPSPSFHSIFSPSPAAGTSWGEPSPPSFPAPRSPSPTPSIPSIGADVPTSAQQPVITGSDDVASFNQGVNFQNLTKLHIKGQLELMTELVRMVTSTMVIDVALTKSRGVPPPVPIQKPTPKAMKKVKGGVKAAVVSLVQNPHVGCFEDILKEILSAWGHSLNAVYIALDDTTTTNPSTISSALFKRLISTPSLERLELSGHTLDAARSNSAASRPSSEAQSHSSSDRCRGQGYII